MAFRKYIFNGLSYTAPSAFGAAGTVLSDSTGVGVLLWTGSSGVLSVVLTNQSSYTNLARLGGKTAQVGFQVFSNPGDGGVLKPVIASGGSYDFNSGTGVITFAVAGDYIVEIY